MDSENNPSIPTSVLEVFPAKFRKVMSFVIAASTVIQITKRRWHWLSNKFAYIVTVPQEDPLFDAVMEWLIESLPKKSQRSLRIRTTERSSYGDVSPRSESSRLRSSYDSTLSQTVKLGRHRVKVSVVDENRTRGTMSYSVQTIQFLTLGAEARNLVMERLGEIAEKVSKLTTQQQPRFFMSNQWGGFTRREELGKRPIESVVLAKNTTDVMVTDLKNFLALESTYSEMGMPWHRGYLFHGSPGTGKTSAAIALSQVHGLNLYYIPLSDLKSNSNLFEALAEIAPRSILLLEDIDVLSAAGADRDEEEGAVTLDGLLNALDGVATPHGLITIMTTNRRDVLDDALIRKGRIDIHVEFVLADGDHVCRLLDRFVPDWETLNDRQNFTSRFDKTPVAPSKVLEAIKSNLNTPELTLNSVWNLTDDS